MVRKATLIASLVLTVLALVPQAASANQLRATTSGAQDASEYWTPERIRDAEPRPVRTLSGPAPAAPMDRLGGYGTFQVPDPEAPPAVMSGKVVARDRSGNYSCSATVVNSSTNKTIFTAAHCVRTKRWGWAKKFTFIPAYDRGDKPFGQWEYEVLYVPKGWSSFKYDYAAVKLGKRNGKTIEQTVGGAGFTWNYDVNPAEYTAYGYPFNFFNGERMMGCFSDTKDVDGPGDPSPIGIECEMSSGASGGGWLIDEEYLGSVTSYGYNNDPDTLYGPYFTNRAKKFLDWVERH